MFESLISKASGLAEQRAERLRSRLLTTLPDFLPKGLRIEGVPHGIVLLGRRLKMRFIVDPRLRAISALAQGLVR